MTATYSLDNDVGKVRLKIGDTDVDAALLTDEEIQYYLTDAGTVLGAAVSACRGLAAVYARKYDVSSDDQSLKRSQVSKRFSELADTLEEERKDKGGVGTVPVKRVDGNDSTANSLSGRDGPMPGGRVRAGYWDPDDR